ncbi:hypothetical protein L3Q82_026840 [Scortum barcoo]|uniref:Uncharacterized protein n=1 Tax=Scortum barcoo TaxID=214431 RepID=A0ACB8WJL6_9TELE|nr:hypothetical protein L3Q82_026840 [Scortum barcoo]
MVAVLESYKQAHTSSPPPLTTLGNSRVVEGPAPLKELGSRAQAMRGEAHHEKKNIKDRYVARIGVTRGPTLEPGLGLGLAGERLVAGSLPTGPGRAQQPEMATWARLPVGSPPAGRSMRGRCNVVWVAVVAGEPRQPNPWNKTLAIGTWNVTSLGGKEPELVREVERYRLEIVGLTSTHSLGSGTQLLERGWTLHYSGVAQGERRRAGVGLLIAPQLSRHMCWSSPR